MSSPPDELPGRCERKVEAPRDQVESPFTEILRRVWSVSSGVLAVVFVDEEGECVDYCSGIEPFEAKVTGAHMRIVVDIVGESSPRMAGGDMHCLELHGANREIVARRVDEQYLLVVLTRVSTVNARLLDGIEEAVADLRREASATVPTWDPQSAPLRVELRQAVAWRYAPVAYWERGRHIAVVGVLGWWREPGGLVGGELSCFRVRTEEGIELTLAHDTARDRWMRR